MNAYEKRAWAEIESWKNPTKTWLNKLTDPVGAFVDGAADLALNNKAGRVAVKAVEGAVTVVNDGASWSVRTGAILREYQADGHVRVNALSDIRDLSLEETDRTVGYLAAKYKSLAAIEGAGTGALGLPGIAIEVPALLALALRAGNEYATYYGYDVSLEHERLIALQVLSLGAIGAAASKAELMSSLAKAGAMAASKSSWKKLEQAAVVRAMQELAKRLGVRLTKAKLAQTVPVAGAVIGSGFNAWFLAGVTRSASMVYRERFLRDKYDLWPEAEAA